MPFVRNCNTLPRSLPSQPSNAMRFDQPSNAMRFDQPSNAMRFDQPSNAMRFDQPSNGKLDDAKLNELIQEHQEYVQMTRAALAELRSAFNTYTNSATMTDENLAIEQQILKKEERIRQLQLEATPSQRDFPSLTTQPAHTKLIAAKKTKKKEMMKSGKDTLLIKSGKDTLLIKSGKDASLIKLADQEVLANDRPSRWK